MATRHYKNLGNVTLYFFGYDTSQKADVNTSDYIGKCEPNETIDITDKQLKIACKSDILPIYDGDLLTDFYYSYAIGQSDYPTSFSGGIVNESYNQNDLTQGYSFTYNGETYFTGANNYAINNTYVIVQWKPKSELYPSIVLSHILNGTGTYTPTSFKCGDTLVINVTCNDGYMIGDQKPYIQITYGGGNFLQREMTVIDSQNATISITDFTHTDIIAPYLTPVIKANTPVLQLNFVKGYVLKDSDVMKLAQKRFYIADETKPDNLVDLAQYITSFKKFYCDINTSVNSNIVLAWFDTQISVPLVADNTTSLDCGSITIESVNNNVNDFDNTEIQIMIPFIGMETLSSDIIGKTISLTYQISNITGDCVAFISDSDNNILYQFEGNISDDIPYIINNLNYQMKGALNFNSQLLYGTTPTLYIKYHDNYNDNNTIMLNDNKYGKLNTLIGLHTVTDVIIDDDIPQDEINLIKTQLESGVIFNQ